MPWMKRYTCAKDISPHIGSNLNWIARTNRTLCGILGASGIAADLRYSLTSGKSEARTHTLRDLFPSILMRGAYHGFQAAESKGEVTLNLEVPELSHVADNSRHKTKVQDASEMEETRRRAAKRREISRRYYEREAKKLYRRQWDPPKKAKAVACDDECDSEDRATSAHLRTGSDGDDLSATCGRADESVGRSSTPETAVAHAALTTMYRMSTILYGARVPLSLAEIDDYDSSTSEASDASPSAAVAERRAALAVRLAAAKARRNARISAAAAKAGHGVDTDTDARIDMERAARMKIHVETRYFN
ncbi:hypothetical protein DFH06DRAFT_1146150 [Mycena polygramma]|nr:hypothetical protein DFH06DRAFT_1146150 [Mycena polygramma]